MNIQEFRRIMDLQVTIVRQVDNPENVKSAILEINSVRPFTVCHVSNDGDLLMQKRFKSYAEAVHTFQTEYVNR